MEYDDIAPSAYVSAEFSLSILMVFNMCVRLYR